MTTADDNVVVIPAYCGTFLPDVWSFSAVMFPPVGLNAGLYSIIVPVNAGVVVPTPILVVNCVRDITSWTINDPVYKETGKEVVGSRAPEITNLSVGLYPWAPVVVTVPIPVVWSYEKDPISTVFPVRIRVAWDAIVLPTPVIVDDSWSCSIPAIGTLAPVVNFLSSPISTPVIL